MTSEGPISEDRVTSLRGAAAPNIGRNFWLVAGTLVLIVFAAVLVVSLLSVANDNARIDRMKTHGIAVTVTVTNCIGNIGGSGSNVSGYTCHGDYSVAGTDYHEVIGSLTTVAASGAKVHGVVDPSHYSTVELASSVANSKSSSSGYIAPGALVLVLIGLALTLRRVARARPR
jgi:hypothetical protein